MTFGCKGIALDNGGNLYQHAIDWKIFELDVLATCRGIKHPRSRTVLIQLLNHARTNAEATEKLRNRLRGFNSSLKSVTSDKSIERLVASIRDGIDDTVEEVCGTF